MKRIIFIVCFCLLLVSSAFASSLSDNFIEQSVGIISLSVDNAKGFLGLDGKETETTKVSKEVFSALKTKFGIDLEKGIEQIGLFIIPVPSIDGKPSFDPILFITGDFNQDNIVSLVEKMSKSSAKEAPKMGAVKINGKNVSALISTKARLLFYNSNMLLLCSDNAVKMLESNKLSFSKAPVSVNTLMEHSKSFIYLGKEVAGMLKSFGEQKIDGIENIESISGYLKEGSINVEAGLKEVSDAKKLMEGIVKYRQDYIEQQKAIYEEAKKNINTIALENLVEEVGKVYSSAKSIDFANDLNIVQKDNSIVITQPSLGGYEKSLVAISSVGILAAMAIPNFKKARDSAREKACFSNMRVLQGAVEMYNMDNSADMTNLDIQKLIKGGYLKTAPKGPEPECEYYSKGDLSSNDGKIACKKHGVLKGW